MNYEAPPKKEESGPITVSHMTKFLSEYIQSDQLGVIDNAHKAHADLEERSVESSLCLTLAELHSLAVDAPKTGKWPEMPKEARVTTFPDFMMKSDKPSYPSLKVLGKLYRECRAFKDTISEEVPLQSAQVDPTLLVAEFKRYLEEAEELYDDYKDQLKTLMNLYGIESEAELLTGCFRKLQNRLGREKTEIAEIVNRVLAMIRSTFRKRFFDEFGLDEKRRGGRDVITPAMKQKASAWYYVAYTPAHERKHVATDEECGQFLSFPWVLYDVMIVILKENRSRKQETHSVVTSINQSLMKTHGEEKKSLLKGYRERAKVKTLLTKAVHNSRPDLVLALFGSSATLLFREDSDIDLCVLKSDVVACKSHLERESQLSLLRELRPAMKKHFKKIRLVENARVPVSDIKICAYKFGRSVVPSVVPSVGRSYSRSVGQSDSRSDGRTVGRSDGRSVGCWVGHSFAHYVRFVEFPSCLRNFSQVSIGKRMFLVKIL